MKPGRVVWLVGIALLVEVANVLLSVAYMVMYSYLIDPGHPESYYQAHVQVAAPWCSIIAGIPLMFAAGRVAGRRWEPAYAMTAAGIVWGAYAVIDLSLLAASGMSARIAGLVATSLATKCAAVWLGARAATIRS